MHEAKVIRRVRALISRVRTCSDRISPGRICASRGGGNRTAGAPCTGGVSTARPPVAEAAKDYTTVFDAWRAANDPQSAVLVVRRGGKTVASRGYNADPAGPTLIDSMSKAITAACTATLIRDGKLSFTTPMRVALSDFFRQYGRPVDRRFEDVTVEQLLTHRSGLHDNRAGDPLIAIRRERIAQHLADVASPQPVLTAYVTQNSLVSVPGRTFG
jgi:CubicO group peptidase (beta-lactamase class C family)